MMDFIAKTNNAIAKFESLVHQIQKNSNNIYERLESFENALLFKEPTPKGPDVLPTCKVLAIGALFSSVI